MQIAIVMSSMASFLPNSTSSSSESENVSKCQASTWAMKLTELQTYSGRDARRLCRQMTEMIDEKLDEFQRLIICHKCDIDTLLFD